MVNSALHNIRTRATETLSRGFTLIEMLIVVGIIVIITSVVLANNSKFGGTILLQNLAYDIALSSREAQIYGVSVLHFQSNFTSAFGMHFDTTAQTTYLIFADAIGTPDGHYQCAQPSTANCELVESTTITRGYYIGQLCVTPLSGSEDCSNQVLDITYNHPEPDAFIRVCATSASPASCTSTLYKSARIVVTSPRGDAMNICFDLNGQISVHGGPSCAY